LAGTITAERYRRRDARQGGARRFLAINAAEAIAEREPVYESGGDQQAGAFGGSPQGVRKKASTPSRCNHFIMARKSLSDQVRRTISPNTSFAIRQTLATELAVGGQDRKSRNTDKDAAVTAASRRRRLSRRAT